MSPNTQRPPPARIGYESPRPRPSQTENDFPRPRSSRDGTHSRPRYLLSPNRHDSPSSPNGGHWTPPLRSWMSPNTQRPPPARIGYESPRPRPSQTENAFPRPRSSRDGTHDGFREAEPEAELPSPTPGSSHGLYGFRLNKSSSQPFKTHTNNDHLSAVSVMGHSDPTLLSSQVSVMGQTDPTLISSQVIQELVLSDNLHMIRESDNNNFQQVPEDLSSTASPDMFSNSLSSPQSRCRGSVGKSQCQSTSFVVEKSSVDTVAKTINFETSSEIVLIPQSDKEKNDLNIGSYPNLEQILKRKNTECLLNKAPPPLKKRALGLNGASSWRNNIVPITTPKITISSLPHDKENASISPELDEGKLKELNCKICGVEEKSAQDPAYKYNSQTRQLQQTSYKYTWINCEIIEISKTACTYWAHCSCLFEKGLISKEIKSLRELKKLTFYCPDHIKSVI